MGPAAEDIDAVQQCCSCIRSWDEQYWTVRWRVVMITRTPQYNMLAVDPDGESLR